ncbi:TraI domain-containing protein [Providencia hangzhouensis]|uniref:Integrating conjugative element relaxase, PFGI-1 class n=1 Tax=Providencia rettgeri TaxID=587 RepID=A0A9N8H0U4_PRORE|nr:MULTISPECIES: TraI domain-containing protein [Providencia]MCB4855679.1 helicase/relaxase domain-containing protein [Providencia rettgeri]MCW4539328.1 helicase/relaxase domain-containing protein [Providencia rettgeri]MDX4117392.1 TraI domain-containing protein [Providencia rettgeri]CAB5650175.1 integrating conjugative element relaxase, PFGI-1 class [Providencia rettgeri]CAB5689438.1 integrating conjugative element relaxase, PFGI-1 class [Providencia rettgeri]
MFKWLHKRTTAKPVTPVTEREVSVSRGNTKRSDEGFYLPQSASELLAAPKRQRWLQQINAVVALPDNEFQRLCLFPLETLAERLQCIPAGRTGQYQHEGGLLDLILHTTAWCVRMSQKEMLPRGVPSEEQARQFSAWNVSVFYTGLLYWLPLTTRLEGQLSNLQLWQPGLSVPAVPFRFRFRDAVPDIIKMRQTWGALIAFRLLPEEAVLWLSNYPNALQSLTEVLTGQTEIDNDLSRILHEALGAFEADSLPDTGVLFPQETSDAETHALSQQTDSAGDSCFSLASADEPNREAENTPQMSAAATDESVSSDEDLNYALMLSGRLPSDGHLAKESKGSEKAISTNKKSVPEPITKQPLAAPETASDKEIVKIALSSPARKRRTSNTGGTETVSTKELAMEFVTWLTQALTEKTVSINAPGGPVHAVAGYVFLRSPHIFTLYMRQCPHQFERYVPIQRAFESLRLHRTDAKRAGGLIRCRLFSAKSSENKPVWQKAAGYLVKSQKLLPGESGDDSTYIEFE